MKWCAGPKEILHRHEARRRIIATAGWCGVLMKPHARHSRGSAPRDSKNESQCPFANLMRAQVAPDAAFARRLLLKFTQFARTSELPEFIGGAEEDRTPDLCSAIAALSQLSYGPGTRPFTWGVGGLSRKAGPPFALESHRRQGIAEAGFREFGPAELGGQARDGRALCGVAEAPRDPPSNRHSACFPKHAGRRPRPWPGSPMHSTTAAHPCAHFGPCRWRPRLLHLTPDLDPARGDRCSSCSASSVL